MLIITNFTILLYTTQPVTYFFNVVLKLVAFDHVDVTLYIVITAFELYPSFFSLKYIY